MNEDTKQNYLFITICLCFTLITFAIIGGLSYYSIVDRKLMADNIDRAIEKGVDPLSVRCSFAKADDIVCVSYATTRTK
jgi:hypothetical protein